MSYVTVNGVMLPAISMSGGSNSVGSNWSEDITRIMYSGYPLVSFGGSRTPSQMITSSGCVNMSSTSTALTSNSASLPSSNGNMGLLGNFPNMSSAVAYMPVMVFNPAMCFNGYHQPVQSSFTSPGTNSAQLMLYNTNMTGSSYGQENRAVSVIPSDSSYNNDSRYSSGGSSLASWYNSDAPERIVTLVPSNDLDSTTYSGSAQVPDRESDQLSHNVAPKRSIPPPPKLSHSDRNYDRYGSSRRQSETKDQGHNEFYNSSFTNGSIVREETTDGREKPKGGSVAGNLRAVAPSHQGTSNSLRQQAPKRKGAGRNCGSVVACGSYSSSGSKRNEARASFPSKKSKLQDNPLRKKIAFKVQPKQSFLVFNPFLSGNKQDKGSGKSSLFVPTKKKDMQVLQSYNFMIDNIGKNPLTTLNAVCKIMEWDPPQYVQKTSYCKIAGGNVARYIFTVTIDGIEFSPSKDEDTPVRAKYRSGVHAVLKLRDTFNNCLLASGFDASQLQDL